MPTPPSVPTILPPPHTTTIPTYFPTLPHLFAFLPTPFACPFYYYTLPTCTALPACHCLPCLALPATTACHHGPLLLPLPATWDTHLLFAAHAFVLHTLLPCPAFLHTPHTSTPCLFFSLVPSTHTMPTCLPAVSTLPGTWLPFVSGFCLSHHHASATLLSLLPVLPATSTPPACLAPSCSFSSACLACPTYHTALALWRTGTLCLASYCLPADPCSYYLPPSPFCHTAMPSSPLHACCHSPPEDLIRIWSLEFGLVWFGTGTLFILK